MPFDLETAQDLDSKDVFKRFRDRFYVPQHNQKFQIYLCGNSLGLQSSDCRMAIEQELDAWQRLGVEGWFTGDSPWLSYHRSCQALLAQIVGAVPDEACPMNSLTVNLHLLLTTFYRPTAQKYKILTIAQDFPSDQYALETHVLHRKLDPKDVLIEVSPRPNEHIIHSEDIVEAIEQNADSLALICLSGLHYYTGQVFDMRAIAQKAQQFNVLIGFDLAHAVGNVPLQLHDWGVDFAVWCSYKYLNAGPGAVGSLFVHQKHHSSDLLRHAGWWGYDEPSRFQMKAGFLPMSGAAGWQVSTPNVFSLAALKASLSMFEEAGGIETLRQKSLMLTQHLASVVTAANQKAGYEWIEIMTPNNAHERGCQLSLLVQKNGKKLFDYLAKNGIVGDWREPNCIRLAPTPLYNSFEEVWTVGQTLNGFLQIGKFA